VAHLDVQQNLDELNLDVHLSYLDVVHLLVVVVDVELHHQLRMDYFQDAVQVDVELLHQLSQSEMKRDYFLGVEPKALVQRELVLQEFLQLALQLPLLHRVMLLALQDQRRVRRRALLQVLGLLQPSSLQRSS
jgi:hypothetical protein